MINEPEQTSQEAPETIHQDATEPSPRVSHVEISLDIIEGTCVHLTIEALPILDEGSAAGPGVIGAGSGPSKGITVFKDDRSHIEINALREVDDQQVKVAYSLETGVGSETAERIIHPKSYSNHLRSFFDRQRSIFNRMGSVVWIRFSSLAAILFGLALCVYLATRLIGLTHFPIYFFTDEAVQTVLAADLVRDGFHNYDGIFLPTYFQNGNYYNLSTSVYLQVIPYLLFGKSIFVTRGVSVLISLLAALSVGLILKNIFKATYWWSGVLLLSIAPAWFLHSRTAFETVIFVSLYAATLYFYLLYRTRSPNYLYPALVMGALAFYAYSPGQVVIAVTGLLLFFSDLPYHWQRRSTILVGLVLLATLAVPYVRFRIWDNSAPLDHLRNLGSYWVQPGPLTEKIIRFFQEYWRGISPAYWFFPNGVDLQRHLMKGYGHLLWWTLPFAAFGLLIALRNITSPTHRVVIAALLAAPTGSALVGVGITRTLVFVIPACLLTGLGLSKILDWIYARLPKNIIRAQILAVGLFTVLAIVNTGMLRDALVNGPTWYTDYGMGGMQYGASQLFSAVKDYLQSHPNTKMIVSPSWSNGTDVVARFFMPDRLPFEMGSIDGHLFQKLPLSEDMVFVMIPDEYQRAVSSGKFTDIRVEQTLLYPNGQPGFFFVHLRYVDNIDAILAAEREARRQLQESEVTLDGQPVKVRYSPLDMGDISLLFDGDPHTLARTLEANPFVVEITFPQPRTLTGFSIIIGSLEVKITARLYSSPGAEPLVFTTTYQGAVDHPETTLEFGQAVPVQILHLEILSVHESEPAHVHVWEITPK